MEKVLNGVIIKGIGGFYYVEAAGEVYECKARGAFRKKKITPLAGDNVTITVREGKENTIDEIGERKNFLLRPPVANIDTLIIVSSVKDPVPSLLVIDKMTAIAVDKGIKPCVIFSKSDLGDTTALESVYRKAGIDVVSVCCKTGEGIEKVKEMISDGITVFTGNTGVGKSSLLNCIDERFSLATGEISDKLGRGRHTTREVTLYHINNGLVADTPGFSSLDIEQTSDVIVKENLPFCFPEFQEYLGKCKFTSCSHTVEKGCLILEALNNGEIDKNRHESYVSMYNDVKDLKEWQM
ncbi:MAG: ribosome small subunit-dependent GTPase A [Ruminococcaceae bacterium]|nr:ribosome small subunit-dependent GTPase A [Oscillospiraceae bacterium]